MTMRNLFAHEIRIGIEFDGPLENQVADPESATLKLSAERLRLSGILPKAAPDSRRDYHVWESAFFKDNALLYFYGKVFQIVEKTKGVVLAPFGNKKRSREYLFCQIDERLTRNKSRQRLFRVSS